MQITYRQYEQGLGRGYARQLLAILSIFATWLRPRLDPTNFCTFKTFCHSLKSYTVLCRVGASGFSQISCLDHILDLSWCMVFRQIIAYSQTWKNGTRGRTARRWRNVSCKHLINFVLTCWCFSGVEKQVSVGVATTVKVMMHATAADAFFREKLSLGILSASDGMHQFFYSRLWAAFSDRGRAFTTWRGTSRPLYSFYFMLHNEPDFPIGIEAIKNYTQNKTETISTICISLSY